MISLEIRYSEELAKRRAFLLLAGSFLLVLRQLAEILRGRKMTRPCLAAIGLVPMERRLIARTTKREEPPPLGSSQRSDDWWLRHDARSSSQSSPHRGKLGGGGSWRVLVSSPQSALHRDQPGGGGCLNVMDNATPVIAFPSPSGKWSGKSMETTFHSADSESQQSSAKSHTGSVESGISFPPPKIRSGK